MLPARVVSQPAWKYQWSRGLLTSAHYDPAKVRNMALVAHIGKLFSFQEGSNDYIKLNSV
jgi:hypothetical protein